MRGFKPGRFPGQWEINVAKEALRKPRFKPQTHKGKAESNLEAIEKNIEEWEDA